MYAFGASDATIVYAVDYIRIYLLGTVFVQLALGLNRASSAPRKGAGRHAQRADRRGAEHHTGPHLYFPSGLGRTGRGPGYHPVSGRERLLGLGFLCSRHSGLRIRWSNLRPNLRVIGRIASLGVAPFIMQSTESLVTVVLNTGLQTYGGDLYVGALTIMQSVMQMIVMPVQGITQGPSHYEL